MSVGLIKKRPLLGTRLAFFPVCVCLCVCMCMCVCVLFSQARFSTADLLLTTYSLVLGCNFFLKKQSAVNVPGIHRCPKGCHELGRRSSVCLSFSHSWLNAVPYCSCCVPGRSNVPVTYFPMLARELGLMFTTRRIINIFSVLSVSL